MRILKPISSILMGLFASTGVIASAAPAAAADVRRADAAQAIISYQEKLAEKQRLNALREAPGVANSVATGEALTAYAGNASFFSKMISDSLMQSAGYQLIPPTSNPQYQYYQNNATNPEMIDISTLWKTTNIPLARVPVAQQLIMNITNPTPSKMSTSLSQALKSTPVPLDSTTPPPLDLPQQAEYVQREMSQALYSIPQRALYEIMATRVPIPGLPNGENQSLLQVLETESTWRMQTPAWFANLSVTPTEGLLREIAQINAMHLWLQYQQYRQSERIEVLMAAMVAAQARMIDQMTAMQQAAQNAQSSAGAASAL